MATTIAKSPNLTQDMLKEELDLIDDKVFEELEVKLRDNAPVLTGALSSSFRREGKDAIVSDVDYALPVDETNPYIDRSIQEAVDVVERER